MRGLLWGALSMKCLVDWGKMAYFAKNKIKDDRGISNKGAARGGGKREWH